MVCDICQLLWKQSNVESVRDTTRAWWSKIQLEVARCIPCKCCNTTVLADAQLVEDSAKLTSARRPLTICCAFATSRSCCDDFFTAVILLGTLKQMHQREWCLLH